jgi:hypothetical protein
MLDVTGTLQLSPYNIDVADGLFLNLVSCTEAIAFPSNLLYLIGMTTYTWD